MRRRWGPGQNSEKGSLPPGITSKYLGERDKPKDSKKERKRVCRHSKKKGGVLLT
ncbi:hypothetical protein BDP55DRAFT_657849 [Colletotrichum godetiae]|uniref:Uncharacterized protein n=1 Tax=Colletotrichum godetiae TaxID=1209918 RepID=A0AAJ0AP80_9PEZI|nr:uncharacterized protein BDP55DRAFT_657849 [Colletotrichum godetiae]KAK1687847.1 hypothetical protein BDP55DRAFT_657849 [Colletotrichum godetiae]